MTIDHGQTLAIPGKVIFVQLMGEIGQIHSHFVLDQRAAGFVSFGHSPKKHPQASGVG
jgi:hypothetical protein